MAAELPPLSISEEDANALTRIVIEQPATIIIPLRLRIRLAVMRVQRRVHTPIITLTAKVPGPTREISIRAIQHRSGLGHQLPRSCNPADIELVVIQQEQLPTQPIDRIADALELWRPHG
jgi:hypothetical protein